MNKDCVIDKNNNEINRGGVFVEAGVRNKIIGKIDEIKRDDIMAQIKMTVDG